MGVVAAVVRYLDITNHALVVIAAFAPYFVLGLPFGATVLLLARRRRMAVVAGVLTIAMMVTVLPFPSRDAAAPDSVRVRVMSSNIMDGNGDAATVARLAREHADVVSVQELTAGAIARLSAEGMDTVFPYRITKPKEGAFGAGLWSRYPLREISGEESDATPITAAVEIPGLSTPPTFVVVHPPAPWPAPIGHWRNGLAEVRETLADLAGDPGPGSVVIAGDFNATTDMKPFRDLLDLGYRDADEQNDIRFEATYPGNWRWPPLLAIDHILVRHGSSSSPWTVTVPNSDHRSLLATVELPR